VRVGRELPRLTDPWGLRHLEPYHLVRKPRPDVREILLGKGDRLKENREVVIAGDGAWIARCLHGLIDRPMIGALIRIAA
jgi:hypothetical protein